MSAQHTPGPWKTWQHQSEIGTNYWRFRTSIEAHGLQDNLGGYCGEANARLIAAAPELLAALESIHALALDQTITLDMDHDLKGCIDNIIDEAMVAIAKAKGETK